MSKIDYVKYYEDTLQLASSYASKKKMGFVRSTMKDVVEGMLDLIWQNEIGGACKKNDYVASTSKSGAVLKFQVDRHLYVDDKLVALGECKAYLDRCFMERASSDFSRIKNGVKEKPKTFILALEDAVGKTAFQYYMDEGHIDNVFYLCDGKRSPIKPIWRSEFYKPINEKKLDQFITFVQRMK